MTIRRHYLITQLPKTIPVTCYKHGRTSAIPGAKYPEASTPSNTDKQPAAETTSFNFPLPTTPNNLTLFQDNVFDLTSNTHLNPLPFVSLLTEKTP